jgi:deoxyribodipyrimidine photo-lyase
MASFEKREYAAYTIRPKIHRRLPEFLRPAAAIRAEVRWTGPPPEWHTEITAEKIPALVAGCDIDHSVQPSADFRGGNGEARRRLNDFLRDGLRRYAKLKNEPCARATSELSPYLHFGHISSLEVALAVEECAREERLIADEFLEELIVRRELAFNFARFTDNYESLAALPEWALKTMREHARDRRDTVYTAEQFEHAETHDELWNAAQKELLLRGKIHGYYRMYWGKKIIAWSAGYDEALGTMIRLHDRYALDGRDPCTYANILWCFGLHDRPWPERPVFGTIRYMSWEGMKRKTDVAGYVRQIAELERA